MSAFWATAAFLSRSLYLDQKKRTFSPAPAPELSFPYPTLNATVGICTICRNPCSDQTSCVRTLFLPLFFNYIFYYDVGLVNCGLWLQTTQVTKKFQDDSGKHEPWEGGVTWDSSSTVSVAVKPNLKPLLPQKQLCCPCSLPCAGLDLIIVFLNAS